MIEHIAVEEQIIVLVDIKRRVRFVDGFTMVCSAHPRADTIDMSLPSHTGSKVCVLCSNTHNVEYHYSLRCKECSLMMGSYGWIYCDTFKISYYTEGSNFVAGVTKCSDCQRNWIWNITDVGTVRPTLLRCIIVCIIMAV